MKWKAPVVVLSSAVLAVGMILSSVTYADSLSQAQQQAQTLKSKKQSTRAQISALSSREASLKSQIQSLQSQLQTLQQQITQNQAELDKRAKQIAALKVKIHSTQQKLQEQYQLLEQRLRIMYEDGHSSYLEVLFSSTSFTDMLNRFELLASIAQEDRKMLQQIQDTKNQLDQSTKDLQTQQSNQKRVYESLLAKEKEQQSKQSQEQQLLGQVHDAKLSALADLQKENAALSSIANEISRLEAEAGAYNGPATGWTWPVPTVHAISSGYGWRILWGQRNFHPGIDIPGGSGGETVVAATSGRVLYAGVATGYGHWIVVQSAGGLVEIYGHIVNMRVSPGEAVHTGEPIATVGGGIQGWSTGPHLHFQVGHGGVTTSESTNPLQFVHP